MNLTAKIITILFYSSEPINITSLAKNVGIKSSELLDEIKTANRKLSDLGLIIITDESTAQMAAKPEYTSLIDEFYDSTPQALSQPALETLSVVAYQQPISKDEIDEIRGVSSEQSIKNLLNKHLIKKGVVGGLEKYKTTTDFLKLMGIEDINQLEGYENAHK